MVGPISPARMKLFCPTTGSLTYAEEEDISDYGRFPARLSYCIHQTETNCSANKASSIETRDAGEEGFSLSPQCRPDRR